MKNTLALAYLGDAVYELAIRDYLIKKGDYSAHDLQKMSLDFVSCKSQKFHLERLINAQILSVKEQDIVKRGRNAKGGKSKSADIITYRKATGLETLIGFLYLNNELERIKEIMNFIVGKTC